jgi:acetyl esterase/lipase
MMANSNTDAVLGATLRPLSKMPKTLRVWILWITGKINPASPEASPLFGACHDLPPTLIQVSNTEVLFDDGCRFAEKARQADSPVTLQVWRGQEHEWQHYDEMIPEAAPALDEIGDFFNKHMSS